MIAGPSKIGARQETDENFNLNEEFQINQMKQQITENFFCTDESSLQEIFDSIRLTGQQNSVRDVFCSRNKLFGTIPPVIPFFPELEGLFLSDHFGLTGTLPDSLFDIQTLETL